MPFFNYVSSWETEPGFPRIHSCTKAVCSWVLLPSQISDCWWALVCACRQNIIQVKQKRRKTKMNHCYYNWGWCSRIFGKIFFSFNNVTTTHEGPGCQDVEDIWWAAGVRCFHCWRQSSYYLTFTLSCKDSLQGNCGSILHCLVGKEGMWLKLYSVSPCIYHNWFWFDLHLL